MKIGLYFDLRNPPAWHQDWSRVYGFALEVCEEADRLGAASLWFTEHHLFEDGYLPQPLTFAAAVAARTKHARIGTGVLIAPVRHAAHVAEEAAVVDILSGGRLELGVGTGYRMPEYDLFDTTPAGRYDRTDALVRDVRALWRDGTTTPPPVQAEVPIWLGYQGPKGAYRAGVLGEGLLSIEPSLVEPYLAGLAAGGHGPSRARMAGPLSAYATSDPERDWERLKPYLAYQLNSYRRYMVEGTDQPEPRDVDLERVRAKGLRPPLQGFLVGGAQEIAAALDAYPVVDHVDTVFFWTSIAGMPEDMVIDHVRLLLTELAPLVQAL